MMLPLSQNFIDLVKIDETIEIVKDVIGATRLGLTAKEVAAVRTDLERSRAVILAAVKANIDMAYPEAGKDVVVKQLPMLDAKRAEKPTGFIQPIGKLDIDRILGFQCTQPMWDNRIGNYWSFSVKMGGVDAQFGVWDFDSSNDRGLFYTYGDAEVLKELFGDRFTFTGEKK